MALSPRIPRRITVIKGSFQTRYVFLSAAFIGALTLLIFLDFSWVLQDSVLGNPTRPDLVEVFANATWTFYLRFVLYILSLIFFLYVLLHRVAGPVLRFQRLAKSVADGDLTHRIKLREDDGLKDLQDDLNRMMEYLTETLKTDRERVAAALQDLEGLKDKNLPPEVRTRLDSVQTSLSSVLKTLKL
jgi:methyl-accepting chemotaxis protein